MWLDGYSTGYSRGNQGVLKGYSRGTRRGRVLQLQRVARFGCDGHDGAKQRTRRWRTYAKGYPGRLLRSAPGYPGVLKYPGVLQGTPGYAEGAC